MKLIQNDRPSITIHQLDPNPPLSVSKRGDLDSYRAVLLMVVEQDRLLAEVYTQKVSGSHNSQEYLRSPE
jgi:hypothetical protein